MTVVITFRDYLPRTAVVRTPQRTVVAHPFGVRVGDLVRVARELLNCDEIIYLRAVYGVDPRSTCEWWTEVFPDDVMCPCSVPRVLRMTHGYPACLEHDVGADPAQRDRVGANVI